MQEGIEEVIAVLDEWRQLQGRLLTFPLLAPSQPTLSWRGAMESLLLQSTQNRACLCWGQAVALPTAYDRWFKISWGRKYYGMLGVMPGYLVSSLFFNAPQLLAQLLGLVLQLAEYQTLLHYQLHQVPAASKIKPLTPRERDILLSLAHNESEAETAERLGITLETVCKHRHRLYGHLDVHTRQQAVLCACALGVLEFLDFTCIHE